MRPGVDHESGSRGRSTPRGVVSRPGATRMRNRLDLELFGKALGVARARVDSSGASGLSPARWYDLLIRDTRIG